MRRCVHADIQPMPCAGTPYSRTIKCKAGQGNSCLKGCSEQCSAYAPAESSVIPQQKPAFVPVQSVGKSVPSQPVRISRVTAAASKRRSPCGTC